ncbi:MAG: LytR C-terminal domain-containing protein [Acidimicrobiales bacterium]
MALIIAAVVLGVVLLRATDTAPFRPADRGAADGEAPTTTEPLDRTTTTAPSEPKDPAQVTVLVANGSGVSGAAGRFTTTVKEAGYATAEPANATVSDLETSAVYFAPGFEPDAAAVAALLTPAPEVAPLPDPTPVGDLRGANVVIVLGKDLAQG